MKKTILGLLLVFAFGFSIQGQIGHLDLDALKSEMPEIAAAKSELESYRAKLQAHGEGMVKELQEDYAKVHKFISGGTTISKEGQEKMIAPLKLKEEEIVLFERYMLFMVESKEAELFNPIQEAIDSAIKVIARENQFQHILNQSSPIIIFSDTTFDVRVLVKAELGLYNQSNKVHQKKSSFNLQAQKIGHLNLVAIKNEMSEIAAVKTELEAYKVQLQKREKVMKTAYLKDYTSFQTLKSSGSKIYDMDKNILASKLNIKIAEFNLFKDRMESLIQTKEAELLGPIKDKIDSAIEAVANENQFQYILEENSTSILFNDSSDVNALVRTKLGL